MNKETIKWRNQMLKERIELIRWYLTIPDPWESWQKVEIKEKHQGLCCMLRNITCFPSGHRVDLLSYLQSKK